MDEGRTHCGDCVEGMRRLPDGSVDCVIADPPFNLRNGGRMFRGGRLERAADMDWDAVENGPWLREALRVLGAAGSLFVFGTYHNIFEVGFPVPSADSSGLKREKEAHSSGHDTHTQP